MLVHLQAAFLLQVAHGGLRRGESWESDNLRSGRGAVQSILVADFDRDASPFSDRRGESAFRSSGTASRSARKRKRFGYYARVNLCRTLKVAALERSDNVADSDHAFAVLKRGYTRRRTAVKTTSAVIAVSSSPVSRATTRR